MTSAVGCLRSVMSTADYSWMSVTLQKGEVEEEEGEPESLVSAEFSQSRPQHPRVVLLLASFPLMYSNLAVLWQTHSSKETRTLEMFSF